ncbi:protein-disulfide reductase DsbD [Granulosicoccus sp. 3-233]|uniref:protein-disulfide reductase DsbD n=1 Tax=Granulosicoccus sp. 3-233 TaxID=3417969 RepID=UPI003D3526EF
MILPLPRFSCLTRGTKVLCLLMLSLMPTLVSAQAATNLLGGNEPLSPQEAFVPSVSQVADGVIHLQFAIAPGYYLYRDKTSFSLESDETAGASLLGNPTTLGEPRYSPAIVIEDDFFGEQATFRDSADVELPYTGSPSGQLPLAVKFQGCADIGLCYPPTTVMLDVDFPDSASSTTGSLASPLINASPINDLFGSNNAQDDLLPPELAFLPQIMAANDRQITLQWLVEPGYYLYRDKLSFTLTDAGGAQVVSTDIDPGVEQYDEFFGNVRILRDVAEARLYLDPAVDLKAANLASLQLDYQGCADIGVCFPPSATTLPVAFDSTPSGLDAPVVSAASSGGVSDATQALPQSEQDRLFSSLSDKGLWLNVATFFGLGLLLAFTPCVLPMVPILSSLIVGQGDAMTTGKAFRLSLVYVLVMASTYAIVGIIVGLSGYNVQAFLQNPWVLSVIAILFVALSLSMFGFYGLQMPTALQARLTQWSNRQGGGQVTGVALMGFISTLIVGPCVTAPLAGALIYIAKTGDAVIGGAALFALGLGMGAPLLLIGTSAGKLLPRAGTWMNATRHIFGILLLAMAVYMISRFLPTQITMGLYGILAVMSAIHLGATDTIDRDSSGWQRFGKGAGVVLGIYGLALLLGALSGGSSYRTPLRGFMSASSGQAIESQQPHLAFERIKSVADLQQSVASASAQGRPVMLDFYADWCISCKEMEAFTFVDPRVQALLADTVVLQADVTANDELDQALLKKFDLFGPPGIIFYTADGSEIPAARVIGFLNAERFGDHLQRFIGG